MAVDTAPRAGPGPAVVRPHRRRRLILQVLAGVLCFLLLQEVASLLGPMAQLRYGSAESVLARLHAYRALPAPPEVVLVGSSRMIRDVDAGMVADELAPAFGHRPTVFNFGVDAPDAVALHRVVDIISSAKARPKLVIYATSEFEFNNAINTFMHYYTSTTSVVDLSHLFRYETSLNFRTDFLANKLLPAYGYRMPLLRAGECVLRGLIRRPDAERCDRHEFRENNNLTMPASWWQDTVQGYRTGLLSPFVLGGEQARAFSSSLRTLKERGIPVVTIAFPAHRQIQQAMPPGVPYTAYVDEVRQIAQRECVPFADYHNVNYPHDDWLDPSHLNDKGAAVFTPDVVRVALDALRSGDAAPSCASGR